MDDDKSHACTKEKIEGALTVQAASFQGDEEKRNARKKCRQ